MTRMIDNELWAGMDNPLPRLTGDQRLQAALLACAHAADVEDARVLLAVLGLHEDRTEGAA